MKNLKGNRGFSLIETLISLVILAVALLSLAAVPIVTTRALLLSDQRAKAAFFASSALELAESANYGAPCTSTFGGLASFDASESVFVLNLDPTGVYEISLGFYHSGNTDPDCGASQDYAAAEVAWTNVLGREKPLRLTRELGPSSHLVVRED